MDTLRIALPENKQNVINYLNVLRALGTETVVISDSAVHRGSSYQQEYLDLRDLRVENYDGLVLPGGWDIDPSRYKEGKNGTGYVDDDLDELQFQTADRFIRAGKPVFGICRGHQLLNIYFGGSLIQDISDREIHAKASVDDPDKLHRGKAEKGSWIYELYGEEFVMNSAHHQAVAHPGQGFVIDSVCFCDGIVEAMHHERLPIWSVQWHPERLSLSFRREEASDGMEIFRYFLRKCRELALGREPLENGGLWNL